MAKAKQPKMVVTSEKLGPELTDSFLPDDEPAAAKLGVARVPLDFRLDEETGVRTAQSPHGGAYSVQEDESVFKPGEKRWFAELFDGGGIEELDDYATREEAEAACQLHADTELVWVLGDKVWTADTMERHTDPDDGSDLGPVVYAIEPEKGGELFYVMLYTEPKQAIGELPATSLEEAKERCQAHYREQHPLPQAEPDEAASEPEPPLKQVDKDGAKRRQRKAEKAAAGPPPLEKGPWVIRRPPGTALLAELAPKQAEAHEEIRVLQKAIEDSAQRHKELKNKKEKEIAGIEERLDELSREVRFGTTATVTCWRRRDGEDWVFYRDKDGTDELWREPAFDGVQQRLCGKEVAKPAYRTYDAAADGTVDELLMRAKRFVAPPCELSEVAECQLAPWPWGEPSWHPFVRARQLELQALLEAADPPPATEPHPAKETVSFERGSTTSRCGRYSLRRHRGLWQPCQGAAATEATDLPRSGPCLSKNKAIELCQRHLDTRHRWPAEWCGDTKLEAGGQYQLTHLSSGMVRAVRVGLLDEPATDLGDHLAEEQAQEACQADADKRRAEAGD